MVQSLLLLSYKSFLEAHLALSGPIVPLELLLEKIVIFALDNLILRNHVLLASILLIGEP